MSSRRARFVLLLPLLLLLAACPDTRPRQEAATPSTGEWVRPFDGYLPDDPPLGMAVIQVVDEVTREPVANALIRQCWEIDVGRDGWAPIVRTLRTDAFGLAHVQIPENEWYSNGGVPDAHWMVHAPGYAAAHEYGGAIEEVIELRRPRTRHGRIVDAMGRPLAHATVGYKEGCGHAPFLETTTTDENGVFVLSGVDGTGDTYYVGRGVLASYFRGELRTLDQTPHTHVADPCRRIVGRVVGYDIGTLHPRMIHGTGDLRGAFAYVEDDGSFVLDGAEEDGLLSLWCLPDGSVLELGADRWRPGHPIVWDVRRGKFDPNASETIAYRRLEVEVLDSSGRPVDDVLVVAYRTEDGLEADTGSRDEDDAQPRPSLSLLPGTYDVMLWHEGALHCDPVRVVVGKDDPAPITLHAKEHPSVDIVFEGMTEEEQPRYDVAYVNAAGHIDHASLQASDGTWIPAGTHARVTVYWDDHATFHDLPPAVDGVRRVVISKPKERTIRFTAAFEPEDVHLGYEDLGGIRSLGNGAYEVSTAMIGTYAFIVESTDGESFESPPYVRRLITITSESPDVIDLGPLAMPARLRERGMLTLLDREGTPLADERVDITAAADGAKDEPFMGHIARSDRHGVVRSHLLQEGAVVAFEVEGEDGRESFVRTLEGPGPWTIQLGRGRILLEVHGPWGLLMKSSVMLNGTLYGPTWTADDEPDDDREMAAGHEPAKYALEYLDAGPHILIVTAPGHRGEARRVILEPGETRRIRVDLPERK